MRRILITGADGFVGHHLAQKALGSGHEVVITDLAFSHSKQLDAKQLEGNILDPDFCAKAIKGIDQVVHLAAISRVGIGEQDPVKCLQLNVMGTANLLEASSASKQVKLFVLGSTREVDSGYATTGASKTIYGVSKKAAEDVGLYYSQHKKLPVVIARLSDVYGEQNWNNGKVIDIFIKKALRGEAITVNEAGALFYFTHIEDVCKNLMAILSKDRPKKQTQEWCNIWPKRGVTLSQLAKQVCSIAGSPSKINIRSVEINALQREEETSGSTNSFPLQGSCFSYPLEKGIQELIDSSPR